MIHVRNLSKVFRIPHAKKKTLFHNLLSVATRRYDYEEFFALNDVSLHVKEGEFMGVMGRNGSGKSTLLKVLANIYKPTSGESRLAGDVYPLLELGIGFQSDFTVKDNLYIYGSFLGISRREMNSLIEPILGFAELERFADSKLDNLSSGMKVRLAFAIAMRAEASIYLVDEILAVGDRWFKEKCREEFRKLRQQKKTVLLVSHTADDIEEFCDRAIVLSDGRVVNEGPVRPMIEFYNTHMGAA